MIVFSRVLPVFAGAVLALSAASAALAQAQSRPGAATNPQAASPAQRPGSAATPAANRTATAAPRPNAAAPGAIRPQGTGTGTGRAAAAGAATGAVASAGAAAAASRPGGHQALQLGTFGDWGAYAAPAGRGKICYALSQPKERLPKELKRDPAYIFVSIRPSENVRNEVAILLGFPTKDGSEAKATVGQTSFDFLTKEQNAWIKNPAQEEQVIQTLSRGGNLVLRTTSRRGNELTDRYSLQGFGPALERARRECQG
jgi:hypothetical protein